MLLTMNPANVKKLGRTSSNLTHTLEKLVPCLSILLEILPQSGSTVVRLRTTAYFYYAEGHSLAGTNFFAYFDR